MFIFSFWFNTHFVKKPTAGDKTAYMIWQWISLAPDSKFGTEQSSENKFRYDTE